MRSPAPSNLNVGARRPLRHLCLSAALITTMTTAACLDDEVVDDAPAPTVASLATPGALDFGGAYGWIDNGRRVLNPLTGTFGCPAGYTSQRVLGTPGTDWDAYLCSRPHLEGREPLADFGGMWGYVQRVLKPNPATGSADCPVGYIDQALLDSSGRDYPLHVCYKPHVAGRPSLYEFGGAWGYVNGGTLSPNPATGAAACPSGFAENKMFGTNSVDWGMHMCMTFPPELDFGGAFGYVNGGALSPNPVTGGASCPPGYSATKVLGTSGTDYEVNVCTRPHQPGFAPRLHWGGMWGYVNDRLMPNWITNRNSCPTGYTDQRLLGTTNVDWDLHVCYKTHAIGSTPEFVFAGLWGWVNHTEMVNPATGRPSCPAGFSPEQVLGRTNVDYAVSYCAPIDSTCEQTGRPCGTLAEQYAPKVWLSSGERYLPSSVELFLANTHAEHIGSDDYLVTNQPLGCDSCTDPVFLDGTNPTQTTVPVYAEVVNRTQNGEPTNVTDVIYWTFYPYNNGKRVCIGVYTSGLGCIGGYSTFGNHVGDWESITIRFVDGEPSQVALSQHSGGAVFDYHDPRLQLRDGRPVVHAAKGSHGLYQDAARHIYKYIGNGDFLADDTDKGTLWPTRNQVVEFDPTDAPFTGPLAWLNFAGRWGNPASGCGISEPIAGECVLNPGPRAILPRGVSNPELQPLQ